MANILSIAPYKYLPPQNGGHLGLLLVDTILSQYNKVTTLSVANNQAQETPFNQLNILKPERSRYLPGRSFNAILQSAIDTKAEYIFCHHHYFFPSAYKVAKKLNIPIYIRSHNIEFERFRSTGKWWWPIMKRFEKWAYKKANKVFFVSKDDGITAHKKLDLVQNKIIDLPFPCPFDKLQKVNTSKDAIANSLGLNANKKWLIFMGKLNYLPNEEAVQLIIENIYPLLNEKMDDYEIIVCGKDLNQNLQTQISQLNGMHYLGFVEDLDSLLYHSDIMLNPVLSGGGVKTKVIESLSWNLDVVSTTSGALGLDTAYCGSKLNIVPDADWVAFVNQILKIGTAPKSDIPDSFFEYYYSGNIAKRIQQYFE